MSKVHEITWLIIAVTCFLITSWLIISYGMSNRDSLVLLFATFVASFMYGLRRKQRISKERKA